MISWYVSIKLAEWVIWWGIGLGCFFKAAGSDTRLARIQRGLGFAFLFFGLGDFVEYFTAGRLPWWLWTWKIVGGLTLFGWLVAHDYHKRGAAALALWRFVAASIILILAIAFWVISSRYPGFQ